MKNILFIFVFLISSLSYGAEWRYATSSTNGDDYYVDRSFFKYDSKNQTMDIWDKSERKKMLSDEVFTVSKSLTRYSCSNKSIKTLAIVEYNQDGTVKNSSTTTSKNFSLIFPETVSETLWHIACDNKGKGLKFREYKPEYVAPSSY